MIVMAFIFIAVLLVGVPVFIALAGSSFIYTHFIAGLSGLRDPAPHGGRHRLVPAARGAVLHPRRQPDELGRHHQPHLRFRGRARGLDARRARARQHHRLGDLRRHVGHRDRGCGRSRHDRDQGDEGSRLRHRILGRRHGRVLDARADHPAVAAVRDLRHDGERLDRRAVSRRRRSRRRDDAVHDGSTSITARGATTWAATRCSAGRCWR